MSKKVRAALAWLGVAGLGGCAVTGDAVFVRGGAAGSSAGAAVEGAAGSGGAPSDGLGTDNPVGVLPTPLAVDAGSPSDDKDGECGASSYQAQQGCATQAFSLQ